VLKKNNLKEQLSALLNLLFSDYLYLLLGEGTRRPD